MTDQELEKLIEKYDERMHDISDYYLQKMGEHIRDIGQLTASDVNRLTEMRRLRLNVKNIQEKIARAASKSEKEIEHILMSAAKTDVAYARQWTGAASRVRISPQIRRIVNAQSKLTQGLFGNISRTTVVDSLYRNVIDQAVSAVQGGVEDYNSAIRREVRRAASAGLRVDKYPNTDKIKYPSGVTRRLDTAVRQNVLDGIRDMNRQILAQIGEEFGADGVEISAHALCAEDHLPYQGQQYSNEDFEKIQQSLKREIGQWNCKHTIHPIIMGVSPKTYSDAQIEQMRQSSTEQITIDGTTHSRYEWSQVMRKMETQMRYARDDYLTFKASGDDTGAGDARKSIYGMMEAYNAVAKAAKLPVDYSRTWLDRLNGDNTPIAGYTQTGGSTATQSVDIASVRSQIANVTSNIADMRNRLADERQKSLAGMDNEYDSLTARIDEAEKQLAELGTQLVSNMNKTYTCPTDNAEFVRNIVDIDRKVEYHEVALSDSERDEDDIISRLAGGDMTQGSCASLGLAYAGQKCGYDVIDFRGGDSQAYFSKSSNLGKVFDVLGANKIIENSAKSDLTNAKRILKKLEPDKEYYLYVGRHAAIVRLGETYEEDPDTGEILRTIYAPQYLELQSSRNDFFDSPSQTFKWGNGWHNFARDPADTFKHRFGCDSKSTPWASAKLIDLEELASTSEFRTILGFINTPEGEQHKGSKGSMK